MPDDNTDDTLEQMLRRACTELEQSLRAGRRERAEQVFARYPALALRPDFALEVIYATEYTTRALLEEEPRPDEYYERFPQFRAALERQFHMEDLLSDVDEGTAAPRVLVLPTQGGTDWGMEHYEIVRQLGQGFPVVVYEARQLSRDRRVVLKMLLAGGLGTEEDRQRFRRGAEDQARLDHPNIVRVYDTGEHEGVPFFAMEFGDGGSLAEKIAGKPQPAAEAARTTLALAGAVQHAHERGIVHRDLKPANVVLVSGERGPIGLIGPIGPIGPISPLPTHHPKITDFGLAKRLESTSGQSVSGDLLGTPPYMAPEQAAGRVRDVGPRTDVYGLGAILYELLTGRKPFEGSNVAETLLQVRLREVVKPRVHNPTVDRGLEAICLKCLAKKRKHRYASAQALAEDLERWQAGKRPQAHGFAEMSRRFVRRHTNAVRAAVATAALTAAVLLVAAVVDQLRDPAREQHRLEAALKRGEQVTLIGETGPPRGHRTIYGEARLLQELDKPFVIDARDPALVELVSNTQHYFFTLTAEVRHDVSEGPGRFPITNQVGFYWAHNRREGMEPEHWFLGLNFNGMFDAKGLPSESRNEMRLNAVCLLPTREKTANISYVDFNMDRKPVPVWRKLTLDVTPLDITLTFGDAKGVNKTIVSQDLVRQGQQDLVTQVEPGTRAAERFSGRGLGLYVRGGAASFRNVILTPRGTITQ